MTYTEMWANIKKPDDTPTFPAYGNLTRRESGYFDALAIALAHWPENRKCAPDIDVTTHRHGNDEAT